VARGIISHDNQLCVTGCLGIETAHHLFLSCPCFDYMWGLVRAWLGFSLADLYHLQDYVIQFVYSSGGPRVLRSFMQLVWLCYV